MGRWFADRIGFAVLLAVLLCISHSAYADPPLALDACASFNTSTPCPGNSRANETFGVPPDMKTINDTCTAFFTCVKDTLILNYCNSSMYFDITLGTCRPRNLHCQQACQVSLYLNFIPKVTESSAATMSTRLSTEAGTTEAQTASVPATLKSSAAPASSSAPTTTSTTAPTTLPTTTSTTTTTTLPTTTSTTTTTTLPTTTSTTTTTTLPTTTSTTTTTTLPTTTSTTTTTTLPTTTTTTTPTTLPTTTSTTALITSPSATTSRTSIASSASPITTTLVTSPTSVSSTTLIASPSSTITTTPIKSSTSTATTTTIAVPTSTSATSATPQSSTSHTTSSVSLFEETKSAMTSQSASSTRVVPSSSLVSSTTVTLQIVPPTVSLTRNTPLPVEGSNVSFTCTLAYAPAVRDITLNDFTWSISGQRLTRTASKRINVTYESSVQYATYQATLLLLPVRASDSGTVQCVVNYADNATQASSTELLVLTRPLVQTYPPLTLSAYLNDTISINCTIANPDGLQNDIFWFRNGSAVQYSGSLKVSAPESDMSMLTVNAKEVVSGTQFSCLAVNDVTGNSSLQSCAVTILQYEDECCLETFDASTLVTWQLTKVGQTSVQYCPNNDIGLATRNCSSSGWLMPDYDQCVARPVVAIISKIGVLQDGIGLDNSTYVSGVAQLIQNFTGATTPLSVGNLNASVYAIGLMAQLRTNADNSSLGLAEIEAMVWSVSNVLQPYSRTSWTSIQQVDPNVPVSLLSATDTYGRALTNQTSPGAPANLIITENVVLQASVDSAQDTSGAVDYPQANIYSWVLADDTISVSVKTLDTYAPGSNWTITSSYYRNLNELMPTYSANTYIGSRVISLTIDQLSGKSGLTPKVNVSLQHDWTNYSTKCVFWDYSLSNIGNWSERGCSVLEFNNTHTLCQCDHLTNFAILMSLSPDDNIILSLISIIGCSISIGAMVLTIVFYCIAWKHLKSHHAVVLINLCIALIIANALFIGGASQTQIPTLCTVIAVLLHYFYLAAFFIMLAEGVEMLLYIVFVFHVRRKYETALLLIAAWFCPMIVVGISLGVTQTEGYGSQQSCWLSVKSGLIWAFVGPALGIVFLNLIIIVVVLTRISKSKFQTDKNQKKNRVRATMWNIVVICPILGTTWVFGILSLTFNLVVFQYIFAVANSLQGVLIFIFHALCNNRKLKGSGGLSSLCFGRARSKVGSTMNSVSRRVHTTSRPPRPRSPPLSLNQTATHTISTNRTQLTRLDSGGSQALSTAPTTMRRQISLDSGSGGSIQSNLNNLGDDTSSQVRLNAMLYGRGGEFGLGGEVNGGVYGRGGEYGGGGVVNRGMSDNATSQLDFTNF